MERERRKEKTHQDGNSPFQKKVRDLFDLFRVFGTDGGEFVDLDACVGIERWRDEIFFDLADNLLVNSSIFSLELDFLGDENLLCGFRIADDLLSLSVKLCLGLGETFLGEFIAQIINVGIDKFGSNDGGFEIWIIEILERWIDTIHDVDASIAALDGLEVNGRANVDGFLALVADCVLLHVVGLQNGIDEIEEFGICANLIEIVNASKQEIDVS